MKPTMYPIRFEIRLSQEHLEMLRELSSQLNKTMSEILRDSIIDKWKECL